MKLAEQFEFVLDGDDVRCLARQRYEFGKMMYHITWNDDGFFGQAEYPAESVRKFIVDGVWRVLRVLVDGNGVVLPRIDVTPLEVGDEAPEGSFEAEMPHVFGEIKYVDEPELEVLELTSGSLDFELFEDRDGKFELRAPDGTVQYRYERNDIDLFVSQGFWSYRGIDVQPQEPEYLPPDDIEPVATFGAELESVRRFCEENEGWYVEVDADFYAVKNYDAEGVVFTVANEAQLAEVMQAIRVLNKYEDRG